MTRPANPYDNASCESFIKTLKREEIYANRCEDNSSMFYRERNFGVLQELMVPSAKRSPETPGKLNTASVPKKNCLTEGVHPMVLRPFCAQLSRCDL